MRTLSAALICMQFLQHLDATTLTLLLQNGRESCTASSAFCPPPVRLPFLQHHKDPTTFMLLQNRVGELYSLIRFLRIYPYAYYFCNKRDNPKADKCDCHSLDYLFRTNHRKCSQCE